jgi:hypothetical protein
MTSIDMNKKDGNTIIRRLLEENKVFSIVRVGLGAETIFAYRVSKMQPVDKTLIYTLHNNAGIYFDEKRQWMDAITYSDEYVKGIKTSDYMGLWYDSFIHPIEKEWISQFGLQDRHFAATDLEPYYSENPWSKGLANKRVLVISPFTDSIAKQFTENREKLFKNPDVLPEFTLIPLKSCQCLAGIKIGDSWIDNYNKMCREIDALDFDVALLGCGGYGVPLINYIKSEKKRSAIYLGGALQILFGVHGKRWDDNPNINCFYNENWVRPSEQEQLLGQTQVENACYW